MLLFEFISVDMDYSMSRNSIVFIQNKLFLVLGFSNHFKIIWSENFRVFDLNTRDKFNWSCISVLGKEGNSIFTCFDSSKNISDWLFNKQSILNLIDRRSTCLVIKPFNYFGIINILLLNLLLLEWLFWEFFILNLI